MAARREGWGGGIIREFGMNMYTLVYLKWDFPDSSVGEESTCNAGDPGSTPGLGRSAGEGIGYPLQYSLASLVARPVKKSPAMTEN